MKHKVPDDQAEQISGGLAKLVDATFDKVKPLIRKTCSPVAEAIREMNQDPLFSSNASIADVEIELGLGFEAEGNLYVTKSKATSNINIKLTLKPTE